MDKDFLPIVLAPKKSDLRQFTIQGVLFVRGSAAVTRHRGSHLNQNVLTHFMMDSLVATILRSSIQMGLVVFFAYPFAPQILPNWLKEYL